MFRFVKNVTSASAFIMCVQKQQKCERKKDQPVIWWDLCMFTQFR